MNKTTDIVTKKNRTTWMHVGICLLLLAAFLTAYISGTVWIVKRAEVGKERAVLLQKLEARYKLLMERAQSVKTTEVAQRRLNSLFLNEKSVADFLSSTELLGRSLGLEISTTYLGAVQDQLSVDVQASGDFAELVRFAGLVERMPYRISISRMSLSGSSGQKWQASYTLAIKSFE